MEHIEFLSFMRQQQTCYFHVDNDCVCKKGQSSKIWIISFFDGHPYTLFLKQPNGEIHEFDIPSHRAYTLTGAAREAEHKYNTSVPKYTIRVG